MADQTPKGGIKKVQALVSGRGRKQMPAYCSSMPGLLFFRFFNGFYGGFPRSTLGFFQWNKETGCGVAGTFIFHVNHL
ncbi:hypothetical protein TU74_09310 [Pseudomonas lundensis]|nr:hypothetical protein TU74_09310 [Pseudomonas lundensis]